LVQETNEEDEYTGEMMIKWLTKVPHSGHTPPRSLPSLPTSLSIRARHFRISYYLCYSEFKAKVKVDEAAFDGPRHKTQNSRRAATAAIITAAKQ